ncbi:MAG: nucleotidyltransferase domain-containing protein [Bryobacterales bacterium]|jgi:hypothetical protein|nr:nucleotidyltransferase domain-containing protein [Bryobacterales bacterium]
MHPYLNHLKDLITLSHPCARTGQLLFATVSGAHLYGFASPDSDYDVRGVHVTALSQLLAMEPPADTYELMEQKAGVELDLVTHEARKFIRLLLKRNGYALEQLLSPLVVVTGEWHQELLALSPGLLSKALHLHYLGFSQNEWKALNRRQPWRVKPLLYTFRTLLTGIHLMRTGEVQANLQVLNEQFRLSWIQDLIALKTEASEHVAAPVLDESFVQAQYHLLCEQLVQESERSPLPQQLSCVADLQDLLLRIRKQQALREWQGNHSSLPTFRAEDGSA